MGRVRAGSGVGFRSEFGLGRVQVGFGVAPGSGRLGSGARAERA